MRALTRKKLVTFVHNWCGEAEDFTRVKRLFLNFSTKFQNRLARFKRELRLPAPLPAQVSRLA